MAIIQGNAKQGSTRGFYPKVINGSLRFNDNDSAYLSWTPASAGNRKTWTWSGWVKKCTNGEGGQTLIKVETVNGNTYTGVYFTANDKLYVDSYGGTGALQARAFTNAVFRDPSAWYHIVAVLNTPASTASDRAIIYVNGVRQDLTISDGFDQNAELLISTTNEHRIGAHPLGDEGYLDGYLANVHFIDGQAKTASDFGETKNGVWVAKDYAGTFGTNGFYLTFEDDTQVEAFNTVLVNGSNKSQKVTGYGFAPDLLWFKNRTSIGSNFVVDTVRGTGKALATDRTDAEFVGADKEISFDSDGFTTPDGVTGNMTGDNGQNYVVWGWKAGDSNVSNTDGTITSTVRANDTYGFSIVSYTGNNTAGATVGHGLSSAPDMLIVKRRNTTGNWPVYHSSIGNTGALYLNLTNSTDTSGGFWNNTSPTSSVFSLGSGTSDTNQSGADFIAYCWSETTGYSKFGSYTGNGSTSGPVITCGFEPALVIIKATSQVDNWLMYDNTRDVTNPKNKHLRPNSSAGEASLYGDIDFLSTGFQPKTTDSAQNGSGQTYIYAAFADTREAAFWLDQSGNDNDWQPVNLDHNDTVADSPTNNFATWNPLASTGSGVTGYGWSMSDGNLVFTPTNASGYNNVSTSTMAMTSGKYYFEFRPTGSPTSGWPAVGLCYTDSISTLTSTSNFQTSNDVSIVRLTDGDLQPFGSTTFSAYGNAISSGDVLMLAVDCDNGKVWWGENGTWFNSGNPTTGTNAGDTFTAGTSLNIFMTGYNGAGGVEMNCGQQPFKYDPPA